MQKKLIALAVAGLISAPAMAQSNVTIYGVVDAGVVYGKSDDNKFRGVQSGLLSASRLGVKGTEDLGNGLKAKFALEYGLNVDTGDGFGGARQSWVGLEGGFGFVGLGRQHSPGHNYAGMLDNFGGSSAFNPLGKFEATSIFNGTPGRWNNAINYKSPSFGGFDVQAIYAFGESDDQSDVDDSRDLGTRYGIGAGYKNAGLKAAVAYHFTEGGDDLSMDNSKAFDETITGPAEDIKEWMIGAGYDFGFMDVNLAYTDVSNVGGKDGLDAQIPYLNVGVPVGAAGTVLLGYAQAKYEVDGGDDVDVDSWTIAYTHDLSKRTTAYVGYTSVDNEDSQVSTSIPKALKAEADDTADGFVVGLRHKF